jgi:alpha-galactosidase
LSPNTNSELSVNPINMAVFVPLILAAVPWVEGLKEPGAVGKLPALGWNSWNAFSCDIDEDKFLTAATQLKSLGLAVSSSLR